MPLIKITDHVTKIQLINSNAEPHDHELRIHIVAMIYQLLL